MHSFIFSLLSMCVSVYPLSLLGNGSVKVPLSLIRNGLVKNPAIVARQRLCKSPPIFARQRLGNHPLIVDKKRLRKHPPTVARQRLGKCLPTFPRQRLGKNPPIVARQRLVTNFTVLTNTLPTIEELLDPSFSTWYVSYRGKQAISFSQNLFVVLSFLWIVLHQVKRVCEQSLSATFLTDGQTDNLRFRKNSARIVTRDLSHM
jgi:hypothetical protein